MKRSTPGEKKSEIPEKKSWKLISKFSGDGRVSYFVVLGAGESSALQGSD